MGQRTRKVVVNTDNTISTTVYHYDFQGMLISETNERGEPIKDYIWLDYAPIAQIEYDAIADSDTIYYLHTDHLMTPRFATDSGGNIVWRWEGEAFGDTLSKSDPDGNGKDVVVNLRFAGQYYDSESQLYYNYFRYYDPTAGRYITSDPIGLDGGLNTYAYVDGNPLYWTDYYGLRGARRGGNPYRDHIPVLRPDPIPHRPPNNNSQPTPNSPMPPRPGQNPNSFWNYGKNLPGNNPRHDKTGPPAPGDEWKLPKEFIPDNCRIVCGSQNENNNSPGSCDANSSPNGSSPQASPCRMVCH